METTLTALLEDRARQPQPPQIRVPRAGTITSLRALIAESQYLAGDLYDRGVRPGELVGMVLQNGTGFLRTFLGVLYAGAVPVPLALPSALGGPDAYGAHLRAIVADSGMKNLVAGPEVGRLHERLAGVFSQSGLSVLAEEELATMSTRLRVHADPDALALVQYTSGSTAAPKGVALTHRNIVGGLQGIRNGSLITSADTTGCWLPLFHDMGLFAVLSTLIASGGVVLWNPGSFVREPVKWLTEFAALGCTLCPAPNFFFDYLARVAGEFAGTGLDLANWRLAYNGAEPVHACTIDEFARQFAPYGFRREAMFPVYGMAEATLAVTFPEVGRGPQVTWVDREVLKAEGRAAIVEPATPGARPLVGVGRAVPGIEIRIAAADAVILDDRTVGEIQITGTPVTGGYYNRPADDYFTHDGWLRTGDLGFLDAGELYVVGRIKDMITVHGTNYYAEDAEAIVRALPDVHHHRCAAVATAVGDVETLALVAETRLKDPARRAELVKTIESELFRGLGLSNTTIHLIEPHGLPQTSSGKIKRRLVQAALAAQPSSAGRPGTHSTSADAAAS